MLSSRLTTKDTVNLTVHGVDLRVAAMHRNGEHAPIVFLHGFGSSKEDYGDIVRHPQLAQHAFLAYDAPGGGETACENLSRIDVPFLVATVKSMLDRFQIEKTHLVGHSMGGLTALLLAQEAPGRILSFINIEGNVAPEDCFLSRQILEYPAEDSEAFFAAFVERVWHCPSFGCALYSASLPHKVRVGAVPAIFSSIVELSDHGNLLEKFLALPIPRLFMYGEQNASLSYLPRLEAGGVRLARVARSGHFPMYSNPVQMWDCIASFVQSVSSR